MNPAETLDHIRASLGFWLKERKRSSMLVGILFCRPTTKLAKDEILPAILDYHYRSDVHTQFYFAGFKQIATPTADSVAPRTEASAPSMEYDSKAFNELVRLIELKTSWKYSGGTDLILTNGRYNDTRREGYLDFSSSLALTLEFVKQKDIYPELGMFFEEIFQFSEAYTGQDPALDLSDALGKKSLVNVAKAVAFRLLPTEAKEKAEHGLQFRTSDLRAKSPGVSAKDA